MKILETNRLILRHLLPDDLDCLFMLYSNREIRRYFPEGTLTYEETKEELEWFLNGHPAHRQFMHADESVQRLPEMALLAGSILSYLAATALVAPIGFWDRQPERTPRRFRRTLMGKPFPQSYPLPKQLRKKPSFIAQLPKGFLARRSKTNALAPVAVP